MLRQAAGRVARRLAYGLLVAFGLTMFGTFVPAIPVLGELGPVLLGLFGPWLVLLSLVGAIWTFMRWRSGRRRGTLIVAACAFFAAAGGLFAQGQQIAVARAHGADIDIGAAFAAGSQREAGFRAETATYTVAGRERLPVDIYRPVGRSGSLAPIFVYVHGGGWSTQSLKQREADLRWFAARGYLVLSLEYSLSSKHRATWDVVQPQLGCALVWIGKNAARLGGDASRLSLWGESAGGNLAVNIAYMGNRGTLRPSCPGPVPRVGAVLALYPVLDPVLMHRNDDMVAGFFGRMIANDYTGGTPDQFPARYAYITSATHISAAAPPTLLVVPEADHLVVPEGAYAFAKKARAAGIDTRMIRMPYAEHAFDLRSGSIGNQLVRQAMLRFLRENGMAMVDGG